MVKLTVSRNVTSLFLLWTVDLSYEELDYYGFVEAYIADITKPSSDPHNIYVLRDNKSAIKQSDLAFRNSHLIEEYFYSKRFKVFKYKIPEIYDQDFEVLILGQYAELSNHYKASVPKKIASINIENGNRFLIDNPTYQLFYNRIMQPIMRKSLVGKFANEGELWKPFNMNDEILNIKKFPDYYNSEN